MTDNPYDGLAAAIARAVEIATIGAEGMLVSYSPNGEYTGSDDIVATKIVPPSPPATS